MLNDAIGFLINDWPQIVIVAGVLGLALLLALALRPTSARRARRQPADRHPPEQAASVIARAERLEQLIAQADQRIAQLQQLTSTAAPREPLAPPPADSLDPLTQSVYDLADAGRPSVEIAQELDEQIGKVELMLALRR